MNAAKPEKLICESCGKKFDCGANVGKCWCFRVEVGEKTLAQLREDYKKCLCKECLEKSATNNTNSTN